MLLTRVEYAKSGEARNFLVVDAAMNDLLRPALYDAWHPVLPVRADSPGERRRYVIAGEDGSCPIDECPGHLVVTLDGPRSVLTCNSDPEHAYPVERWLALGSALHADVSAS